MVFVVDDDVFQFVCFGFCTSNPPILKTLSIKSFGSEGLIIATD